MVDVRDHLKNNNLKNPVCKLWGFQSLIWSQWSFGASLVLSFQLSRASSSPFLSLSLLPLYLSHHLPLVSHLFIYLPARLFVSPPSSPSSVPALNCVPGPSSGGRWRCWHPEWLGGRAEAGQILPPSLITWEKGGELDMDANGGKGVGKERERQRGRCFMRRGENEKGVSSHPTQSSTAFHPSSASAQRLPLLHQQQLPARYVRVCVCTCTFTGEVYEYLFVNVSSRLSV